jgi:hypothetical protein
MQFDPGLTTSAHVQSEMIRELEAKRPKVIVLLRGGYISEPNASSTPGSALLDNYIALQYRVVASVGEYEMLLHR